MKLKTVTNLSGNDDFLLLIADIYQGFSDLHV